MLKIQRREGGRKETGYGLGGVRRGEREERRMKISQEKECKLLT